MSLNRYFEFSRRQLWFLAAFSLIALVAAGWLVARTYLVPPPNPPAPAIVTGTPEPTGPSEPSDRVGRFMIDPNSAPADSLEMLPGIGPVKAARIIAYREKTPFEAIEDLIKVNGIGPATLEMIRPFVKVSPK